MAELKWAYCMGEANPLRLYFIFGFGLVAIAFGSIFVKLAQEAPSLVIAFFRMFWASVILAPFYYARQSGPRHTSQIWLVVAGLALALHFALWVSSLRYTSVAVSVLLVNTSPVLVALFSYFVFRERVTLAGVAGISLAFLGGGVLFLDDLRSLGDWRGTVLALGGAAMLAVYLVSGRRIRQGATLIEYVYPTYLLAAVLLATVVWLSKLPITGFSWKTHLYLLLLGLVPQCLGHTSYNWALKYLSATIVSTVVLAEPILATLFAYWILEETIGMITLGGGVMVALGIVLVSRWGIVAKPGIEAAAAIIQVEDKIWIRKREHTDHLQGYWEFPGGKVKEGESPHQALVREINEELSLKIESAAGEPMHIQEYSYPERFVRIHFFRIELERDAPLGTGQWIHLRQLDQFIFPPANREVIEKLREH